MDAKEEVRARINIEDVIGEYVELKRAGRNFKGLSPFSGEKTPSFFVSPEKNIWHDFSSNKGGDVFSFVMQMEGIDFREALELLARKAGVELTQFESAKSREIAAKKKRHLEAHALAAAYYQQCLLRNQHAMEYVFKQRGLSKQVVQDFKIGYAPDTGSALTGALMKKGFTKAELGEAGLLNRFGGDMFRGRMMVPLMDTNGQVIGFTGRIIGDVPNAPKYLNTPQTLLYDKGRHIFALSQAKEAIRTGGVAVVVEGNLDVVSSHQAGVSCVVATAGTAMTEHHLKALRRLTSDVRLAYDGDKAGIAAAERAIEMAKQEDMELAIISMTHGAKDPDELIKQDPALWRSCVDQAQPAVEWLLHRYGERADVNTARGKQQLIELARQLLTKLDDRAAVRHYSKQVASMTGFGYEEVLSLIERGDVEQLVEMAEPDVAPVKQQSEFTENTYRHEDDALAIAAIDTYAREQLRSIDVTMFHGDERRALAAYLAATTADVLQDTPKDLQNYDTYVKIVLLKADTRYAQRDTNDRYYEMARLLRQVEHEHKKQTLDELTNQLRNAERTGDEPLALQLRVAVNDLIKEIARGRR